MELTTVREIFRNEKAYLNQKITVGGWLRSVRDSKTFGFLVLHDGTFLNRSRWFIMIKWKTLQRFPSSTSGRL